MSVSTIGLTVDVAHTYFIGKSIWAWAQLLIVPFALALVAVFFQWRQKKSELEVSRHAAQVQTLQAYMDRMSELLTEGGLRDSEPKSEVRKVARGLTVAVAPELNGDRKAVVLRFLYESRLIRQVDAEVPDSKQPVVSLERVDFSHLNMPRAFLKGAQLRKVNLRRAVLVRANLQEVDLTEADLEGANLTGADVTGATISPTTLRNTRRKGLVGEQLKRNPET